MRASGIFLFVALFSHALRAQLNESDTATYQLNTALRGSLQTGNVELLRVVGELEATVSATKRWVFKTQNQVLYQEIFGNKADNNLLSQNYLYYNPQGRVYPYVIGFVSNNFRRAIDQRYFVGPGATLAILQRSDQSLKLSANLVYESTQFSQAAFNLREYDGSNTIELWRSTVYLRGQHFFMERTWSLHYALYWQQSLEDQVNHRYSLSGGFDFKVMSGLYAQTRVRYDYENVVSLGVRQRDLLWLWGISYNIKSK